MGGFVVVLNTPALKPHRRWDICMGVMSGVFQVPLTSGQNGVRQAGSLNWRTCSSPLGYVPFASGYFVISISNTPSHSCQVK